MSEQAREAERRLIREHPPEKCMICSLPAPDSDDWQGHHERIADLERQLAEAKTILSDLPDHSDVDAAVFEANALRGQLAEVQGKLDAVREWRQGLDGYPNDWAAGLIGDVKADLDRILKEEK